LIGEIGLEPERFEIIISPSLPSPSIDQIARQLFERESLLGASPLRNSGGGALKETGKKE
jgi:hypothetical protein